VNDNKIKGRPESRPFIGYNMSDKSIKPISAAQRNRRDIAESINRALQSCDMPAISQAISSAIRLHNVSDVAAIAGIARPSVYRAFSSTQSPNLTTVLGVLKAMGFRLKVAELRGKGARLSRTTRQ
jgi:probable addiction module antidote protein